MKKRAIIISIIAAAICLTACKEETKPAMTTESEIFTISETTLREVLDISQMSTVEYTYNSIVDVTEEDELKYSISYNGHIKAGIDFSQIAITVDSDQKSIVVTVPEAEITETVVDISTLDYIFQDTKYDTETTMDEAYSRSCEDLQAKATNNGDILSSAKENAISAVKALLEPWVEQAGYKIEVK